MNHGEIDDLINHFTYKPGWRIRYKPEHKAVWISRNVPDSTKPGNPVVKVGSSHPVPVLFYDVPVGNLTVHGVQMWLRDELRRCEMHELDEFLRYRGELINDPHANGRNTL